MLSSLPQRASAARLAARLALAVGVAAAASQAWAQDSRMSADQARALENPVEDSVAVLREGRKTYLRLCQYCHGADGRAQANPDFEAPSLRDPSEWRYGTSDGELFVSIRDGAGHDMPPFRDKLEERGIWELVHYIRSIGPTARQR